MGVGMAEKTGICSLCMEEKDALLRLQDGYLCESCFRTVPWECKTIRVSKGIGMVNKYAERLFLSKMCVEQITKTQDFMRENALLRREFRETCCVPECGMVIDAEKKLFFFELDRATLSPALKEALLPTDIPQVVFRAEWVSAYWLDFAYYKTLEFDGAFKYHPQYAQIVLQFEHSVLCNKSIRLEVNKPMRVELMMKRFYNEVAEQTLKQLEMLTGLTRSEDGKTYYDS